MELQDALSSDNYTFDGPYMKFLDFEIVNESVETLAKKIVRSMDDGEQKKSFACINPHSYAVALEDVEFFASIKNSSSFLAFFLNSFPSQIPDLLSNEQLFKNKNNKIVLKIFI